jgi:hypothetical protein
MKHVEKIVFKDELENETKCKAKKKKINGMGSEGNATAKSSCPSGVSASPVKMSSSGMGPNEFVLANGQARRRPQLEAVELK